MEFHQILSANPRIQNGGILKGGILKGGILNGGILNGGKRNFSKFRYVYCGAFPISVFFPPFSTLVIHLVARGIIGAADIPALSAARPALGDAGHYLHL